MKSAVKVLSFGEGWVRQNSKFTITLPKEFPYNLQLTV